MKVNQNRRNRSVPRILSLDFGLVENRPVDEGALSASFGALSLEAENNTMADLARIEEQLAALLATNQQLTQKVTQLETKQTALENANAVNVVQYTDIVPVYANGDAIQLDAIKVVPEFNGERKMYRSWRSQVSKLMDQIEAFKAHPKYAAALSIIRAKITGAASDILINNDTAHNIDAIIDRLDFSYSDQRPLYVIEAEMTNIKQGGKLLQEYYDNINQALNMVITKIAMTYKEAAEQRSLIAEAQGKATRTFVTGLNSSLIRSTLYGSMPKSLSQAFSVAQTIQYDNQHLQLEAKVPDQNRAARKPDDVRPNFNPNFRYQSQQPNQAPKPTNNVPQQYGHKQGPTPMDIDGSGQHVQRNQAQPNGFQQMKRQREPSFQRANGLLPSSQHVNKQQRINHLDEPDEIQSIYDNSLENNYEPEAPETGYTTSEQESTFLEE